MADSEAKQFRLMPPPPHLCQECAWDHSPDQPHNAQSFFYKVKFNMDHGRVPTWRDALAHCDDETKVAWEVQLRERGAWID